MHKFKVRYLLICFCILFWADVSLAQNNFPHLILNKSDVLALRKNWKTYPVFQKTFLDAKAKVDSALTKEMDVPVPKDAAGYTHEKHKQNYSEMYLAGIVYQVTQDTKYAAFVKKMLLKYADLYPTLKQHPEAASSSPGRLFWQSLNEYVWMVNTTQAYDCIYDYLTPADRTRIEENVFRKMADFFVVDRVHELDLIHNHGTWSCAAVGLAGIILKDKDLIDKALYGSTKDSTTGFIKQIECLISPDGYYMEGAYYARYALMPFYIFAQALDNNMPVLKIFEFRDRIFKKVFYATLQQTYTNGNFLPINDAIKDKNYLSPEIVSVLDMIYDKYGSDDSLLEIAKKQNRVMLSGAGLKVAKALAEKKVLPEFVWSTQNYTDGPNGDEGGLSLLRFGGRKDQSLLAFKYTAHGQSHGHYDKLTFLYYDQGTEIIQDYGSARFINVDQKWGGRYLPVNKSFAMQTVAHNTMVVDEKSHFGGKISVSEKYHPTAYFFSAKNPSFQISSAKFTDVSNAVKMQRTMALVKLNEIEKPVVIDIFKVDADKTHQYDLPFYYLGDFISTNIAYTAHDKEIKKLGKDNGYQHLWNCGEGKADSSIKITWLNGERFYSLISSADTSSKVIFTRIGASDKNFDLRNDPGIIIRNKAKSFAIASIIEPHGKFDGINEFTQDSYGKILSVRVLSNNEEFTSIELTGKNNLDYLLIICNNNAAEGAEHTTSVNGKMFKWTGPYNLVKL